MTVTINHEGYQRRLAVVKQILHSRGLQPSRISTLAYSEEYQYAFNNFLYKVELEVPASFSTFPGTQPGTVKAASNGVSVLVIKLSNLAVGMNNGNRVENDVAAQYLVRQSMAHAGLAPLVPDIYAWAPVMAIGDVVDEKCFGWIISELMSGVDLDSEFSTLDFENKEHILEQIAAILAAIQAAKLPEGVTKFGGLTFDSSGRIVSGEAPLFKGEPVESYVEWRAAKLRAQLQLTVQSLVIQGWRNNGVNARIENFLTNGGPEKVLDSVDLRQKVLIHGDFTTNNMLFDKNTKKITAILDFDWSYVSNPFEEFMSLLSDLGCNITDVKNEMIAALLSGNFTTPPANADEEAIKKWKVAKAWNVACRKSGVISPCDIKGVDKIRDLMRFQALLCPSQLRNEGQLKMMGDELKAVLRTKAEADLVQWLVKYGF